MAVTAVPAGPKSWVPRLPSTWVSRPRLLHQLDVGGRQPLTTVIGPPGVGKTSLVAEWFASRDEPVRVWLTLDTRDNQPNRFASLLASTFAAEGTALPDGVDPNDLDGVIDALLEASAQRETLLVLDDAQELIHRRTWEVLARVAAHPGERFHLVIITRSDPPFGMQRLKMQGRVAEIRAVDLMFDHDETVLFLARHGLDVASFDVDELCAWAGGWIAALSLAAHAMAASPDEGFLSHRDDTEALLADFVLQEALSRMSVDERRFVLFASVADVLTPELATVLTGAADAEERLRRLERTGAFLLCTDRTGRTFRFHGLMATLLRARLNVEGHDVADALARSAARWYATRGMDLEAEAHAIRGGDWDDVAQIRTARLLATVASTGRAPNEIADLPPNVVAREPAFAPLLTAAAIERGDGVEATRQLERTRIAPTPDEAVLAVLVVLAGCAFGATSVALDAVESLLQSVPSPSDDTASLTTFALVRGAELRALGGDLQGARALLVDAEALPAGPCANDALALRALCDVLIDGRPVAPTRAGTPFGSAAMHLARALGHALDGEIPKVHGQLSAVGEDALPSSQLLRSLHATIATATSAPTSHTIELPEPATPGSRRALVALGHLEYFDERGSVTLAGTPSELAVVRARRALARGSPIEAADLIADALSTNVHSAHPRTIVEAATIAAIASLHRGREADAVANLERALTLAEELHVRGPLVAWGPELRPLLDRHVWELAGRHPGAVELADQVRAPTAGGLVEPLTDREQAVLRHLPTLMSNAEIAQEMLVSINTVKTHLKAIYRKLGVERRRDAVLRARRLGLL
jgi:LuxR family maltose regulon positive regulatory protein